jgi:pimeloyl-ACP methyl ester carboxylesterase
MRVILPQQRDRSARLATVTAVSTPPFVTLPRLARPVRLSTPRGDLAAVEAAPEGGEAAGTALLVPGFTGSKEDFIGVLEPLASAGWRVVAVDLRGQHDSPHAADPSSYDIDALADDLLAIADGLGAGPVHLLGHSFGGLVARAAVVARPDAWRSLVLLASGPGTIPAPTADRTRLLLQAIGALDLATIWGAMRELDAEAGVQRPAAEIDAFLERRWLANDPASVRRMAEQLLDTPDRTDDLRATGVPVLVAYGEADDAWPPAEQADMATRLGADAVAIAGAGHSPAAELPDETAALLDRWWRTHA